MDEFDIRAVYRFTGLEGAVSSKSFVPIIELVEALSLVTFCVIVLRNGMVVTGESVARDPDNFNADFEKETAYKSAVDKLENTPRYAYHKSKS